MGGAAGEGGRSNIRGWLAALAAALLAPTPSQDPYRAAGPSGGPCQTPSEAPAQGPYRTDSPGSGPCRLRTPTTIPPTQQGPYLTPTPQTPRNPYTPQSPTTGPCDRPGSTTPHLPPPATPSDPPSTIVVQDDRTITVNSVHGPTGFPIHLIEIPTGRRVTIQIRPDDPAWRQDPATQLWTLQVPIDPGGGPYHFEETSPGTSYVQARGRIDKNAPMAGLYTLDMTIGVAPADLSLSITGPGVSYSIPRRLLAVGSHSIQVPVNPSASGVVVATAVFTPVEDPP